MPTVSIPDVSPIFIELLARFDINIVIFTNITQKEEAVSELQASGILGPDGLPNTEKYEWKTILQGAATTVAAAFDPRISGTCLLSLVLHLLTSFVADKPGSYLVDSTVANESIAPHSSDPVSAHF
jgi:hypothetical protein